MSREIKGRDPITRNILTNNNQFKLFNSLQEIVTANIDRRGTHIIIFLTNHDGSGTTNLKYVHEVPSHLFKPFFRKPDQEMSDCKSMIGCSEKN